MTNQSVFRASDFLNSIGVDTHIPYTDGGYANIGNVGSDLAYLGVHNVRDGISNGMWGSAWLSSYIALAKQGIRFTAIVEGTDTASLNAQLAIVQQLVQAVPGSVTAVEGPNEINNQPLTYNGIGGLQGALNLQKDLYAAVHSNPTFAGVVVDYFTGYAAGSIAAGPDPSLTAGLADNDTQHPYPQNGDAPGFWVDPTNTAVNEAAGHIGPLVYTETGYSTASGIWGTVDTTVQAKYTLDLLLDAMKDGVAQTDLYQLMDAYAPGSRQGDDGFGLFNTDNSPKLAATALHDLTTILADAGPNATSFRTGTLAPTVAGLPVTGHDLILEKSSGVFDIVLWAEPQIWNPTTRTEIGAPTQTVTVGLGGQYGSVSVFDPLLGSAPIATYTHVGTVQVGVSDHPVILEVSGLAPKIVVTSQILASDQTTATLTGTVSGAPGTTVAIFAGTTRLGAATLDGTGGWSFSKIFGPGLYQLHAVATDLAGNTASVDRALVVPSVPTDTLVLTLSEDAYLGDVQFTVSVDGHQIGGVQTVTALHGAGRSQTFSAVGSFGPGSHHVGIDFLNDLYRGTRSTDRNLYVGSIALDGRTTTVNAGQHSGGTATYTVAGGEAASAVLTTGSGRRRITVADGETVILGQAAEGAIVRFAGGGALELDDTDHFYGAVAGFRRGETLDLPSIAFNRTTIASLDYASRLKGGILTLTDGTHEASLSLHHPHLETSFHLSADRQGGTVISFAG